MTYRETIDEVARRTTYTRECVKEVLDTLANVYVDVLVSGEPIIPILGLRLEPYEVKGNLRKMSDALNSDMPTNIKYRATLSKRYFEKISSRSHTNE